MKTLVTLIVVYLSFVKIKVGFISFVASEHYLIIIRTIMNVAY